MKCSEERLIDFIEGSLNDEEIREVEAHLLECDSCKRELVELQEMIAILDNEKESVEIPNDFMKNVRKKVVTTQKTRNRTYKHSAVMGLIATLFLTIFVGTAVATNGFATFFDWWKDLSNKQNEKMEEFIEHGLGDQLNLVAESNGVKVTINSIVADDIQTLIYYEVEDMLHENKYMVNLIQGINIANMKQFKGSEEDPSFSPVNNQLNLYSESENVYKGRLGISAMSVSEGKIELQISKLEKVANAPSDSKQKLNPPENETEFIEGDWSFEIPVKKHEAIIHKLNVETEIEGNPVVFDKLTIAPTATILSYRFQDAALNKKLEHIQIAQLETKKSEVNADIFGLVGTSSGGQSSGWITADATFESLYFEKPKQVKIHVGTLSYSVEVNKEIPIDINKELPQIFEFMDNQISINKIDIGNPTIIEMTEELPQNRKYEMLHLQFDTDNGNGSSSNVNGYFIDKAGEKYKVEDYMFRLNELDQPRFFSTEHHISLGEAGPMNGDKVIPTKLVIEGYTTTIFTDEVIKINLD
ncbi:DUF4179 domain-containing protein [Ferdinandcohnia quinoae]|uniref:Anti-sigma-W factor RsiW n=1 Tax=Fredinandcohnia quinoae TaxID=2918902 RepID=A0AAW5EBN4_9BACI|nr:DUF4179 domain-containing protein [Fredinandcohnia sp. SECRCQ15]MCH1626861.1 DUF4179 domain-containing protein [Fredinandcohnia sp. SECRCQ15]